MQRTAGVQCHITSLPSGRLGPEAHAFADWLAAAGQSWWQVLPLGPPDEHGSPYKAASAFAGWPGLLHDPDAHVDESEVRALREREPWASAWEAFGGSLADQVRFDREWAALREHCATRGVRLIGDVPIYVAPGSADHVTHPELFLDGVQAGVPPDAFSDDGQLWGNPLYDWPALRRRGYRWWVQRLARTYQLFDLARIDHFRGFVAFWEVDAAAGTARAGRWRRGPGRAVFAAAERALGRVPLIAEDLGVITPAVERLRDALGLPGMRVMQWAFDPDDPDGPHRLAAHTRRAVVYTGTHDNDTLAGWWAQLPDEQREVALAQAQAAGIDTGDPEWAVIELAASSPAELSMVQLQDVLGLGSEARMNVPGVEGGNWGWRVEADALDAAAAARLRRVTAAAGRLVA